MCTDLSPWETMSHRDFVILDQEKKALSSGLELTALILHCQEKFMRATCIRQLFQKNENK